MFLLFVAYLKRLVMTKAYPDFIVLINFTSFFAQLSLNPKLHMGVSEKRGH